MSKRSSSQIHIPLTQEERDRVTGFAETRGLPTSTFVRYVLAGVASRGGGTLDRILQEGESILAGKITHTRRAATHNIKTLWATTDKRMRWVNTEDPQWELRCNRRPSDTKNHGVKSWWYLTHTSVPDWRLPLAFTRLEAARLAADHIQSGLTPGAKM